MLFLKSSVMTKTVNYSFSYLEYDKIEELNDDDRLLLLSAVECADKAYAPYSGFKVGAAIRLENGIIVNGVNIENAAFPSGICAERSALANAASGYPGNIPVALAIAALNETGMTDEPVSPCGNCRQVIIEEEYRYGGKIKIILGGKNKIRIINEGSYLLPLNFNKECMISNPR